MNVLTTAIALAACSAAAALAAPVAAQSTGDNYTAAVSYGDLNLDSVAGRAAFHGRVKARAGLICGAQLATPLKESRDIRACRDEFIGGAERRIQFASKPVGGTLLASR